MIGLQVGLCAVSHHPQSGGDGPPPCGKDGAGEEDVDVRPNGLRKNRREDRHDTEARGRQREHRRLMRRSPARGAASRRVAGRHGRCSSLVRRRVSRPGTRLRTQGACPPERPR